MKPPALFRLLGPLSVLADGDEVDVGHPKQRCVLVVLLAEAGRPVPTGTLLDRVWGEAAPRTARNALYNYVTQLRTALAPLDVRIIKRSSGYVIHVDPEAVDLHQFHGLVEKAKRSPSDAAAVDLLTQALDLYAGLPFEDLHTDWIDVVRTGLLAERRWALLRMNDILHRLNRHAEALHRLRAAAAAAPLDESLAEHLMLSLHRSGQQAAALWHYHDVRQALDDDLGISPSPRLRDLYQQLLRGDASLAAPVPPAGEPARCRKVRPSRGRARSARRLCARCARSG